MTKEISKFLSYVLRHAPQSIGLTLDAGGWADISELLDKSAKSGKHFDFGMLQRVVKENDKQRFTLSDDGTRIRAAQGHSVTVDLGLESCEPPSLLYHGTAKHNLDEILNEGLKPGRRQQVHLSSDPDTARRVGERHGKPVVLTVDANRMHKDGFQFVRAENGVWLTNHVPQGYLGERQA